MVSQVSTLPGVDLFGLVRREPAAALRGLVTSYYGYREEPGVPTRRREGPGSDIVVILSFDTSWWIGDALDPAAPGGRFSSFTGGMREGQVLTEHAGRSHGMQVNLSPHAARAVFRVPMDSLAERIVPLEDLLGRRATLLVEQLQETPNWAGRFAVVDAALASWLADEHPPQPAVEWAWQQLRATHGRVRVSRLAEELGWSRKRLVAGFREHVGLPPKTVARVLRFEQAVRLAEQTDLGWLEIAFRCGYYDQAHLSRDFRAISGCTPGTFFQDVSAPAA
jgi:AraC-like DNA-binding protein